MKKIGILSVVYHNWNYGGMLQGYALCAALNDMGYPARQIRNTWKMLRGTGLSRAAKKCVLQNRFLFSTYDRYIRRKEAIKLDGFRAFEKKIPFSDFYASVNIAEANKKYECFIAGSDQIWSMKFQNEQTLYMYGLLFAEPGKRKISYAASIGAERTAHGHEDLFREVLNNLDCISVREKAARDFLQPLTDKPVAVTADPTLLLTGEEWDKIAVQPPRVEPYAFAYFLQEKDNRHTGELHHILSELDLPMLCIADETGIYPRPQDEQIFDAGPAEFLGYIRNAEIVLTDSFHGMVFSVLYNKPFWVFKRNRDDDRASMNSRITDFLSELGLEDRLLQNGEFPTEERLRERIDYAPVNRLVQEKREFSFHWLKDAVDFEK